MKSLPVFFVLSLGVCQLAQAATEPRFVCVEDRVPVGGARTTVTLTRAEDGKYSASIHKYSMRIDGQFFDLTTTIADMTCKYEVQVSADQEAIELKSLNCGQNRYTDGKRQSIWFGQPTASQVETEGPGYRITETTYTARPGWGEVAVAPQTDYRKLGEFGFECTLNMPIR